MSNSVDKKAVLVLGMHRSGTSAITAGLEALGVSLGAISNETNFDNVKGFFENKEVVQFNERLFQEFGFSWDNPFFYLQSYNYEKLRPFLAEAVGILSKYYNSVPVWAVKDPRMCVFLSFWQDAIRSAQCGDIYRVHILRNPLENATSLLKRREKNQQYLGGDERQSILMWFQHHYQALSAVDDDRNILVTFEDLLKEPLQQLKRLASFLEIQPDQQSVKEYVDSFLEKDLKHHSIPIDTLRLKYPDLSFVADFYEKVIELRASSSFTLGTTEEILVGMPDLQLLQTCSSVAAPVFQDAVSVNYLQQSITSLTKSVMEKDSEASSLTKSVIEKDNQISSLTQSVIEKDSQVLSLTKSVLDKENQIRSLARSESERDVQILSLSQSVSDLERQVSHFRQTLKDESHYISQLSSDLKRKKNEIEKSKKIISGKNKQYDNLKKKYIQITSSISWRTVSRLVPYVAKIPGIPSVVSMLRTIVRRLRLKKFKNIIEKSGLFDVEYYLATNPKVKENGLNPLIHFIVHGGFEGRRPNSTFDPVFYLETYPDAASSLLNPLVHYILFGKEKGLRTQNANLVTRPFEENTKRYTSGQTILFVGHDASQTGAPKVLLDLLQWFKKATALDIRIVLLDGGVWRERFQEIAPTLVLSDFSTLQHNDIVRQVDEFSGNNVKAVYLNTVVSALFLDYWNHENIPLFAHIHEMQESIDRFFSTEMELLKQKNINYIAVSPPVHEALVHSYGVTEEQVRLIYPFISSGAAGSEGTQDKKELRLDLQLPADWCIVLGCGVIYPRKGVDLFLKCAKEVLRITSEPLLFVWIGGGYSEEDLPAMQKMSEEMGIAEHVLFTGAKPDPKQYFRAGDIFLMTSREDPFPLVCLEAAACGNPVICFDEAGGMPGFVCDDAGFVVPYLDTKSMAKRVLKLLEEPNLCTQLGEQGRKKVLLQHTVEKAGVEILYYLRDVAKLTPAVSVIVPNYNHERYLQERLESIYNQDFVDIEVLLLDDKSTDESVQILDDFANRYPNITTVLCNEENSGSVCKQWKKGVDNAHADIVWIAESDDVSDERFLRLMTPQMADSEVMVAYCQSYIMTGEKEEALTYLKIGYYDILGTRRWEQDYVNIGTDEITKYLAVYNTIPNVSSTLLRARGLVTILDTCKYKLSADWAFYIRHIEGGKIAYFSLPLNFHRVHSNSVIRRNRNEILFQEFWQIHYWISKRYCLHSAIKKKMISYLTERVYPRFGKGLDKSFNELYNVNMINDASPYKTFEPKIKKKCTAGSNIRPIAFYLPQFHAIPENDEWWGEGFTEWTNVKKAEPLFDFHYQPREPQDDFGYYDLTDWKVIGKQVDLAKLYGIYGFCFYHYWFAGKRLLESPVDQFLSHKEIDFPFCLCWANENWTRCWDGQDKSILIAQEHSREDDLAFIADLSRYVKDSRYLKVGEKPLIIIYRPELFPQIHNTVELWRTWCRENGIGEIYLAYMQGFGNPEHPEDIGFDAKIEFPPLIPWKNHTECQPTGLDERFNGKVVSYPSYVRQISLQKDTQQLDYPLFHTVMMAWDNTARRKMEGTVFTDFSVQVYREWLQNTIEHTQQEHDESQQYFFINAWNEWAEGTYLEPDNEFGYACLNAVTEVCTFCKGSI